MLNPSESVQHGRPFEELGSILYAKPGSRDGTLQFSRQEALAKA